MIYTTDTLIAGIKRRGSVPTSQTTFQTVDFLASADSEIQTVLLPMILKARESYYSFDVSQSITPTNGVYAIPTRAIGMKLQGIYLYDSGGQNRNNLSLVEEEDIVNLQYSSASNPCFFFKGNNVVLVPPNPTNFDTLVMTIFIRPSQLISTTAAALVSSVSGNTVTVNSVPSNFTTSTTLDLIKGNPGYDCYAVDQLPTVITSNSITFNSLPTGLQAGDWIALSGQTPVVQIPAEFQGILEQRVTNSFLRSQGFSQALNAGLEALKEMESAFLLINPRAEREAKKIVNRSGIVRKSNWWR